MKGWVKKLGGRKIGVQHKVIQYILTNVNVSMHQHNKAQSNKVQTKSKYHCQRKSCHYIEHQYLI